MPRSFTPTHQWIDVHGGTATVGLTARGQALLGELVLVALPKPGRRLAHGEEAVVVESVKAASGIPSPLSGTVTAANALAEDDPALVNADPEGAGWLFRLTLADRSELDALMTETAYRGLLARLG